jgi:F-type H+-transporting ATPase subunit b
MRNGFYRRVFFRWLPGIFLCLHGLIGPAFGADGVADAGGWRSTYDEVMLWVNFGIFVLVIVKFGRAPLLAFLKGKKEEVEDEINQVETKKQRAEDAVQEVKQQLADSNSRLDEIKARIVSQGEKRKARIIARAQTESETMLNSTKIKIEGHLASARERLRVETIDAAISMALKQLPDKITEQDDTQIIDEYLKQALPQ